MATKNASKPVNLGGLDALAGFTDLNFGGLIAGSEAQAAANLAAAAPTGEPKMVKRSDILEDARQIRKRFKLDEMRASIRENVAAGRQPIKTPLIVKPHPTIPDKYQLGDGARRLRSAALEGVDELPIVVDENFDDFDQVSVNLQRDGNTPVEIADFIAQKLSEGFKKGEIAARLGQAKSWISKHVALIGMPDAIRRAYDEFRLNDVEAMYLLVNAHKDYPAEVDVLCTTGTETISKYTVMDLLESLKNPAPELQPGADAASDAAGDPDGGAAPGVADASAANDPVVHVPEAGTGQVEHRPAAGIEAVRPALPVLAPAPKPEAKPDVKPEAKPEADIGKLRKAIVQVQHDERPARLLLDRRAAMGLAWIKYDDDGAENEIDIGTARLVGIVEGG